MGTAGDEARTRWCRSGVSAAAQRAGRDAGAPSCRRQSNDRAIASSRLRSSPADPGQWASVPSSNPPSSRSRYLASTLHAQCPMLVARLGDHAACLPSSVNGRIHSRAQSAPGANPSQSSHRSRGPSPLRSASTSIFNLPRFIAAAKNHLSPTPLSTRSRPPPETGISALVRVYAQSTPDELRTHASLRQLHSPVLSVMLVLAATHSSRVAIQGLALACSEHKCTPVLFTLACKYLSSFSLYGVSCEQYGHWVTSRRDLARNKGLNPLAARSDGTPSYLSSCLC
jgi:hypothetical protein